ncbi:MAG: TIGR03618 family F420-dependent PPOX class oxidoreductase [Acidimicrobiia bacterium]|nr:TIGR03618 family F420-dependent PPOX class oxidoreductase [Acidimicrobiia bacterium]
MELRQAEPTLINGRLGTLVTLKRNGRPQISDVGYHYADGVARISITEDRAKTTNIRRDPRVSLHVRPTGWGYVVTEGMGDLSPVSTDPGDETGRELLEIHDLIQGKPHPDPDTFFEAMVTDNRLVLSIGIDYVYGALSG